MEVRKRMAAYSPSAVTSPTAEAPSQRARILVVDDEPEVADLLTQILEADGYEVVSAATGQDAEAMVERARPDMILLDLILPDTDGLVLCSQLHARWDAPIIVVSATKRVRDRVLSLRLGADDFIAKPFDVPELVARVEAVMRRVGIHNARRVSRDGDDTLEAPSRNGGRATARSLVVQREPFSIGELAIDPRRRAVTVAGQPVHLTPTEYRLLTTLASEPERVFSREELAEVIWGAEPIGQSRAVDVHIRRLRAKLEPFGVDAPPILTVRGFGYKLGRAGASTG